MSAVINLVVKAVHRDVPLYPQPPISHPVIPQYKHAEIECFIVEAQQ